MRSKGLKIREWEFRGWYAGHFVIKTGTTQNGSYLYARANSKRLRFCITCVADVKCLT